MQQIHTLMRDCATCLVFYPAQCDAAEKLLTALTKLALVILANV